MRKEREGRRRKEGMMKECSLTRKKEKKRKRKEKLRVMRKDGRESKDETSRKDKGKGAEFGGKGAARTMKSDEER